MVQIESSEKQINLIGQVVNSLFAVFDNRNNKVPDLNEIRQYFVEEAIITKHQGESIEVMSLEQFISPRLSILTDGTLVDFYEYELNSQTKVDGQIASRMCEYMKRGMLNGELYEGRGKKHFQLIRVGEEWKIVSIIWEDFE